MTNINIFNPKQFNSKFQWGDFNLPISERADAFKLVPIEIILSILEEVPIKDILSFGQTSKYFFKITHNEGFWNHLFKQNFSFYPSPLKEHSYCEYRSLVRKNNIVTKKPFISSIKNIKDEKKEDDCEKFLNYRLLKEEGSRIYAMSYGIDSFVRCFPSGELPPKEDWESSVKDGLSFVHESDLDFRSLEIFGEDHLFFTAAHDGRAYLLKLEDGFAKTENKSAFNNNRQIDQALAIKNQKNEILITKTHTKDQTEIDVWEWDKDKTQFIFSANFMIDGEIIPIKDMKNGKIVVTAKERIVILDLINDPKLKNPLILDIGNYKDEGYSFFKVETCPHSKYLYAILDIGMIQEEEGKNSLLQVWDLEKVTSTIYSFPKDMEICAMLPLDSFGFLVTFMSNYQFEFSYMIKEKDSLKVVCRHALPENHTEKSMDFNFNFVIIKNGLITFQFYPKTEPQFFYFISLSGDKSQLHVTYLNADDIIETDDKIIGFNPFLTTQLCLDITSEQVKQHNLTGIIASLCSDFGLSRAEKRDKIQKIFEQLKLPFSEMNEIFDEQVQAGPFNFKVLQKIEEISEGLAIPEILFYLDIFNFSGMQLKGINTISDLEKKGLKTKEDYNSIGISADYFKTFEERFEFLKKSNNPVEFKEKLSLLLKHLNSSFLKLDYLQADQGLGHYSKIEKVFNKIGTDPLEYKEQFLGVNFSINEIFLLNKKSGKNLLQFYLDQPGLDVTWNKIRAEYGDISLAELIVKFKLPEGSQFELEKAFSHLPDPNSKKRTFDQISNEN